MKEVELVYQISKGKWLPCFFMSHPDELHDDDFWNNHIELSDLPHRLRLTAEPEAKSERA